MTDTNFTAKFVFQVNGLHTINLPNTENIVKQVDWVLTGYDYNSTFEMSRTTELTIADEQDFIPFTELTESMIIEWINLHDPRIYSFKEQIQFELDRQNEKVTIASAPLPWIPVQINEVTT